MPVPRLSKRISRPIAARRSRKRSWRRSRRSISTCDRKPGTRTMSTGPSPGHLVGDAQVAAACVAHRRGRGGGGAPRGLPAEEGGGLAQVACVEALLEAAVGPRHQALRLARAARVAQEPPQAQGRPQLEGAPALSAGDVERPARRDLGLLVVAERPQRLGAQPVELGVVEEPAAAGHVVDGLAQDVEGLGGLARADERVGEQPQEVGVLHPDSGPAGELDPAAQLGDPLLGRAPSRDRPPAQDRPHRRPVDEPAPRRRGDPGLRQLLRRVRVAPALADDRREHERRRQPVLASGVLRERDRRRGPRARRVGAPEVPERQGGPRVARDARVVPVGGHERVRDGLVVRLEPALSGLEGAVEDPLVEEAAGQQLVRVDQARRPARMLGLAPGPPA